jgi:hypothetical protein
MNNHDSRMNEKQQCYKYYYTYNFKHFLFFIHCQVGKLQFNGDRRLAPIWNRVTARVRNSYDYLKIKNCESPPPMTTITF